MGFVSFNETAEHDGIAVADSDGCIERAFSGVGHVADAADGRVTIKIVNLLLDFHGDHTFGIDERGHVQFNTDGKLLSRMSCCRKRRRNCKCW